MPELKDTSDFFYPLRSQEYYDQRDERMRTIADIIANRLREQFKTEEERFEWIRSQDEIVYADLIVDTGVEINQVVEILANLNK